MTAERLVAKLEHQQEMEWQIQEYERKRQAANPVVTLDHKVDAAISMIRLLQRKKQDIYAELGMRQRLQLEHASCMRAVMELREANLTAAERRERDEETDRGRRLYSRIIPELSPSWREEAASAFKNKKL